ncbi:MAG: class I SAM-dependent methyltransferase [Pseudomonadota bacterium]
MTSVMTVDEFVAAAKSFKGEMAKTSNLQELHALWRQTSYAYSFGSSDPFSTEHKHEVLKVYEALCDATYEVSNEVTSATQTPEQFKTGYPWVSKDLGVVATEMGKSVQAMRVFNQHMPNARRFIEFGSGWGNLAVPLARAGMDVTTIDIDVGFLKRMTDEAHALGLSIETIQGDFLEAAQSINTPFDAVVFCSSFHHCLDFSDLLTELRERVVNPDGGKIFFLAEPISDAYSFPWGLRYDGESVWAITCNHWLELGFTEEFFREALDRTGFIGERHEDPTGFVGAYWVATPK